MASSPLPDRYIGRFRNEQGWIGGTSPLDAAFVPPPPEMVPRLVEDLVTFISRTDLPAVVQSAVSHAQFETIHPFGDGNGRIGRILVSWILRHRGVMDKAIPPITQ